MPTTTHEPSGLIAIRALVDMERERQDRERAEALAREEADRRAREAAEVAARDEAEARARREAEAAEQARRAEAQRQHEERLRAIELEARVRAAQAAHLARIQAELDAHAEVRRPGGRVGLWTAVTLGGVGLGLALLLKGPAAVVPAPVLAPAADDGAIREARDTIARMRGEIRDLERDALDQSRALAEARAARAAAVAVAPTPSRDEPGVRPRSTARPRPVDKKLPGKPGGIKICATNDPLAEDC